MNVQMPDEDPAEGGTREVSELLAQQGQLHRWLDSLAQHVDDVPSRIADRVRSDYEARLQRVVAELSAHEDAIRADVERLRDAHRSAQERSEDSTDQLEEARLRHRIGELDDAEWAARRVELDRRVEETSQVLAAVAAELGRLEELLDRFGPAADPEPHAEPGEAPGDLGDPRSEPQHEAEAAPTTATSPGDGAVDDLDFLAGLDRAMAASEDGTPAEEGADLEMATRPRTGVKCPECGYTNDSTAWYCGVCGVDLA